MAGEKYRLRIEELLAHAGVELNGSNPWDIQVHNEKLYPRIFVAGSLGLGEAYTEGWWDSERLDACFFRLMGADLDGRLRNWKDFLRVVQARLINRQNRTRAYQVGRIHYDAGNDLYARMLDRRMIYSCAYWQGASCLDAAQEAKLDLIRRKLDLRSGMRVLDIGCGWGGTARFLAERCGVEVVGVTISREQARLARESCRGLPVDIRLQDYRQLDETFDRVLSVGMFEHVGCKNYRTFMEVVRRCLTADGLFLLHTIGGNRTVVRTDGWIDRYIFPNAMLPSAAQVTIAAEGLFVLEDWHNFGADYDRTLMAWFGNFDEAWPELREKYGEGFYRMWKYYLLSCAGTFRARRNQLWQIVFSPKGVPGGHRIRAYNEKN
jgi:cyclopropane-fatty-acyl-phospholipid synthase